MFRIVRIIVSCSNMLFLALLLSYMMSEAYREDDKQSHIVLTGVSVLSFMNSVLLLI